VRSASTPGSIVRALPAKAPAEGEAWSAILHDLEAIILPGLTHWESPRFMAYFKPHSSAASVVGELLSAGINAMGFRCVADTARENCRPWLPLQVGPAPPLHR